MRQAQQTCIRNDSFLSNKSLSIGKRRIHNLVCISAAFLLSMSSGAEGFSSPHHTSSLASRCIQQREEDCVFCRFVSVYSTSERKTRDSWSRGAEAEGTSGGRKESRFGVRRRVKSVLEKARNRTGVRNYSEDTGILKTEQTALDIIADAASIGGLGAVLVDEEKGTVDVALDFVESYDVNRANPTKINGSISTASTNVNGSTTTSSTGTTGDSTKQSMSTHGSSTSSTTIAKNPASTYSPSTVEPKANPEDALIVAGSKTKAKSKSSVEVDALKADVSAAFAMPASPLPFTLPELSNEQLTQLEAGERVQYQSNMSREGSGYVVVDVKAPPYVVWECLLDFESYPETIPTVRDVTLFTSTHLESGYTSEKPIVSDGKQLRHCGKPSITRAVFTLSKFKLKIAAIHKYRPHPSGDYMIFTLDQNTKNMVLQHAKGVWHTQENVREGYTRVWLLCELKVSRVLPRFIVDYAAKRAMPRATSWLKPQVEAAADLWLKNAPPVNEVSPPEEEGSGI